MSKLFLFFLNIKISAYIMAFINLLGGMGLILLGGVKLSKSKEEGDLTLYIVFIVIGIITIGNGLILTYAIIQGKERAILLYLLLSCSVLMIGTIYTGINMFEYKHLTICFGASVFMWYCQFSVYNFYEEMAEYNTVKSGVIEISFQDSGHVNQIAMRDSFENTNV